MSRSTAWMALCLVGCGSAAGTDAGNDVAPVDAVDVVDATQTLDAETSSDSASMDHGNDATDAASSDAGDAAPNDVADAAPIVAPMRTWTWVDFPESSCNDGTPTGIGINPAGSDLLIFFNGGGACWDYTTCFTLHTATSGPFGATQFATFSSNLPAGTIFDRNDTSNPFRDASLVFIPYCTGDLHGGDRITTYSSSGTTATYAHRGHSNAVAFLTRLAATFPAPNHIIVSGSSAGGYGAVLNDETVRALWPSTPILLLDDSGPLLEAPAIPQSDLDAWYANWGLGDLLDGECGPSCRTDFSAELRGVITRHPTDRVALLSSEQDQTIRSYLLLSATQFQTDLLQLATDVYDPSQSARYFFVAGQTHTMLGAPANFTQVVPLWTWLTQFATNDPAWTSQKP